MSTVTRSINHATKPVRTETHLIRSTTRSLDPVNSMSEAKKEEEARTQSLGQPQSQRLYCIAVDIANTVTKADMVPTKS